MVIQMSDKAFAQVGLSPTAAFILMSLQDGDQVLPSQLAKDLFLDRSTITRFLDKLTTLELITRAQEGRHVKVTLTASGQALQPRLQQLWTALNQQYQQVFGVEGEQAVRQLLNEAFAQGE